MKTRIAVGLLLSVLAVNARAEWMKIAERDTDVVYMDVQSMRRDGDIVKVWFLSDWKVARAGAEPGSKILSSRQQRLINCREESSAGVYVSQHTERQARGKTVFAHTLDSPSWAPIAPDTALYDIAQKACKTLR